VVEIAPIAGKRERRQVMRTLHQRGASENNNKKPATQLHTFTQGINRYADDCEARMVNKISIPKFWQNTL
jgi:hypothetical protein